MYATEQDARGQTMAVRFPHGLQDVLRYASRSQNIGLDFSTARSFTKPLGSWGRIVRPVPHGMAGDSNEREQQ